MAAWRAWGVHVVAPLILFFPILLGQVPEMRDFPRFAWPARALWRAALLEGRLPQWNPFVGLGAATLGAPVHGTFYPPNLLLLVGSPLLALGLLWLAHTILAGIGGYTLARRLGCRTEVAVASGLVWQLGGFAVSLWSAGEKVLTCAWVPWAALGLLLLAERELRRKALAGTAAAFALIALAGDPFVWMHAAALGLLLGWAVVSEREGAWPVIRRLLPRAAVALLLAGLLAAVSIVPALALLGASERAGGLAWDAADRWSFSPARLAELLIPPEGPESADALITSAYLGLAAMLCAPFAGRRRLTWALTGLALMAFVVALGRHAPAGGFLRAVFPPFRYMRYPEKHLLVVTASLALLGALGAERLLASPAGRQLRLTLVTAAGMIVLPLGLAAGRHGWGDGFRRVLLISMVLAGGLALARRRPAAAWFLPVLVAADLLAAAFVQVSWTDARRLREAPPQLGAGRPGAPPPRLYYTPSLDGALVTVPENVGNVWGIAHIPGFDPGRPGKQRQVWDALIERGLRAAELFDVEWLVLPRGLDVPGLREVASLGGTATLFHRPTSGRLHVVGRAHVMDDARAIPRLRADDFSPAVEAVVAPGDGAFDLDGTGQGTCVHELFAPEHERLRCRVRGGPTLLVESEAWSPGWRATVDGLPVPIMRTQIALRGIYLGPGEHVVELRFRTPGLWLGIALSLLGLIAMVVLLRRRRAPATSGVPGDGLVLPSRSQLPEVEAPGGR